MEWQIFWSTFKLDLPKNLTQEQQIEEIKKRQRTQRENFDELFDVIVIWGEITVVKKTIAAKLQETMYLLNDWILVAAKLEDWLAITREIRKAKNLI